MANKKIRVVRKFHRDAVLRLKLSDKVKGSQIDFEHNASKLMTIDERDFNDATDTLVIEKQGDDKSVFEDEHKATSDAEGDAAEE